MDSRQYQLLVSEAKKRMSGAPDSVHSLSHVENVEKIALKIMSKLKNKKKIDKKLISVMCLWHDISYSKYGFNLTQYFLEASRSSKMFKKYATKIGVGKGEREIISKGIFFHGLPPKIFFFIRKSIYYKILQDADAIEGISGNLKERHNTGKQKKSHIIRIFNKFLLPIDQKIGPKIVGATLLLPESKKVFSERINL